MDRLHDHYQSYSWHQSHDQATILVIVPHDTTEDDVTVILERNYLVAGVRGQSPIVKGRLYGNIDTSNSAWQLEPRTSARLPPRERTTSTTSTASTQSSYALVSDPEISSSFAASLENGLLSDTDETVLSSPALSSPISGSLDEHGFSMPVPTHYHRRQPRFALSHPTSPSHYTPSFSLTSSLSSLDSLHSPSGRLLTLYLEKAESVIWPSLVVGPVPETLSPCTLGAYPWAPSPMTLESKYNMDPTSLVLFALDLYDIRKAKEDAFEYFVRAWHQARLPSATIRLATHYLPVQTVLPDSRPSSPSPSSSTAPPVSPTTPRCLPAVSSFTSTSASTSTVSGQAWDPTAYYLSRVGGRDGLARLFLAAGLLYLEGAATPLLASSYAGLSSLRSPNASPGGSSSGSGEGWRKDREAARRFFERARALCPALDVPLLPPEADSDPDSGAERRKKEEERELARLDVPRVPEGIARRRRRKPEGDLSSSIMGSVHTDPDAEDEDRTWYLYVPGLVGAGTALLVVGLLSLSSWRKSQGS